MMVKIRATGRIRMFLLNRSSSPSLCHYSTLFLIQLLSSIKRLFLIKFTSSSRDFWSLGLPWNEPLAIIIDSAVNRLESNGFRDQLWNKKHSGNKQTSGRAAYTNNDQQVWKFAKPNHTETFAQSAECAFIVDCLFKIFHRVIRRQETSFFVL